MQERKSFLVRRAYGVPDLVEGDFDRLELSPL
jgi:hypothetical protein